MNHDDWMDAVMYALKAQTAPAPKATVTRTIGDGDVWAAATAAVPAEPGQCMDDPTYDPTPPEPFEGQSLPVMAVASLNHILSQIQPLHNAMPIMKFDRSLIKYTTEN